MLTTEAKHKRQRGGRKAGHGSKWKQRQRWAKGDGDGDGSDGEGKGGRRRRGGRGGRGRHGRGGRKGGGGKREDGKWRGHMVADGAFTIGNTLTTEVMEHGGLVFSSPGRRLSCLQSTVPLSAEASTYSVTVIEPGAVSAIAIGLAYANFPLLKVPGKAANTIGAHFRARKLYDGDNDQSNDAELPSRLKAGDVVAVSIALDDTSCTATWSVNGDTVAEAAFPLNDETARQDTLYPTVGLNNGAKVTVSAPFSPDHSDEAKAAAEAARAELLAKRAAIAERQAEMERANEERRVAAAAEALALRQRLHEERLAREEQERQREAELLEQARQAQEKQLADWLAAKAAEEEARIQAEAEAAQIAQEELAQLRAEAEARRRAEEEKMRARMEAERAAAERQAAWERQQAEEREQRRVEEEAERARLREAAEERQRAMEEKARREAQEHADRQWVQVPPATTELDDGVYLDCYAQRSRAYGSRIEYQVRNKLENPLVVTLDFSGSAGWDLNGAEVQQYALEAYETKVTAVLEQIDPSDKPSLALDASVNVQESNEDALRAAVLQGDQAVADALEKIKDVQVDDHADIKSIIASCNEAGTKFVDTAFPPTALSIDTDPAAKPPAKYNSWRRAYEFQKTVQLFDGIDPMDMRQGALGDCWFCCALSAVAEFPPMVQKLFPYKDVNEAGVCKMRLCKNGEWVDVVMDDYFPCYPRQGPVFAKNQGDEMWVLLAEKAYAKVHGSYNALRGGCPSDALADLTGCPVDYFNFKDEEVAAAIESGEFWPRVLEMGSQENLMAAGSMGKDTFTELGTDPDNDAGVVPGNAGCLPSVFHSWRKVVHLDVYVPK